jgi:hypothetical protein
VLQALAAAGQTADLTTGAPCLFCLKTLDKTPWSPLTLVTRSSAATIPGER